MRPKLRAALKSRKPKGFPTEPVTLGEHLLKRSTELGLLQREVALRLDVSHECYPRSVDDARSIGEPWRRRRIEQKAGCVEPRPARTAWAAPRAGIGQGHAGNTVANFTMPYAKLVSIAAIPAMP